MYTCIHIYTCIYTYIYIVYTYTNMYENICIYVAEFIRAYGHTCMCV